MVFPSERETSILDDRFNFHFNHVIMSHVMLELDKKIDATPILCLLNMKLLPVYAKISIKTEKPGQAFTSLALSIGSHIQALLKITYLHLISTFSSWQESELPCFPRCQTIPEAHIHCQSKLNLPAGEKIQNMQHIREKVLLMPKYLQKSSIPP